MSHISLNICKDIFCGFFDSVRIDIAIKKLYNDQKLQKKIIKIAKFNTIMYLVPYIITYTVLNTFDYDLFSIINIVYLFVNVISGLFHLLYFIDLIDIVCVYTKKLNRPISKLDSIGLAIVSFVYQLSMYIIMELIDMMLYKKLDVVSYLIKFIILTLYHSFCCFNNLWHYKNIDIHHRISLHEKLWAYYLGYGTIASLMYIYSNHPLMIYTYNIYMSILIILPFMIKTKYPKKQAYPSINLKIFSIIVGYFNYAIKLINNSN
ncbi:putative etoposide-induced protein 2.4 [Acanthamoeba castellanii mimivirus]|uniref:Uncharacterized protein L211 n=5 Tax=Mimivirus TaxID=315393 RepID=YL211_MIMIV|nr:putative etoposide-induced protein 2.4 [Acanthamoeba polyphaga mimivirus]Q5UQ30.1 RecName: Full=Uncharacterized protein L211 [Acanthamoeba polyphaga mimivirus]ALR83774.1 putative etoposide-induced protein 2.4 [Niemeyer virus]AMK61808.1 etoposide-induced protein [Samba virus]AMZ02658.1 putative etoposide-induced protein 2.4 [Mimivirus Bombay]QTF49117.1 putative etoposide-induced protein 2.4 [Mimivirus reunion]WMV61560.1 putative etoposide-induced protein 2.4 [Mimivirus sp.]BAV61302.1 putat